MGTPAPMPVLPVLSVGQGQAVRTLLDAQLGAIEIGRPTLDEAPYRDFVRTLLRAPGFKLDFNRLEPDAALALVSDQLLGPGVFRRERDLLAADIAELAALAEALVGSRPAVSVRTYFVPGDLVWHVDRVQERIAFRFVWPLGRPAGMCVTPAGNIDLAIYRAFMHREFPLLCRLDAQVLRAGATFEALWAHRPAQLEAMRAGRFPFLIDPELVATVSPGAASIHRIATPAQAGAFHRSSWANRDTPGFQVVITAASDRA